MRRVGWTWSPCCDRLASVIWATVAEVERGGPFRGTYPGTEIMAALALN